ncbi:AraC family transcriptional regulator, partial [Streptomyces sp. ME02-6987-2C]|nr:AraC family transcriptional regulator [Streptomyces sp. ME02-6987-2C]
MAGAAASAAAPYRVALVAFPGIRAFDVAVITEVWGTDRTDRGAPAFDLRRVAADGTTAVPIAGAPPPTPRPLKHIPSPTKPRETL